MAALLLRLQELRALRERPEWERQELERELERLGRELEARERVREGRVRVREGRVWELEQVWHLALELEGPLERVQERPREWLRERLRELERELERLERLRERLRELREWERQEQERQERERQERDEGEWQEWQERERRERQEQERKEWERQEQERRDRIARQAQLQHLSSLLLSFLVLAGAALELVGRFIFLALLVTIRTASVLISTAQLTGSLSLPLAVAYVFLIRLPTSPATVVGSRSTPGVLGRDATFIRGARSVGTCAASMPLAAKKHIPRVASLVAGCMDARCSPGSRPSSGIWRV
ncbi:hypothetical protein C8R44DRAFT_730426 [Mycena epipterygia]|nr:hypothetical protein C8R44DRAFT_730426 [Mycena epipterygia]